MFMRYVREFLNVEGGLKESQKEKLAMRIERWAKDNQVGNTAEIHRILDNWIDEIHSNSRFLIRLDRTVGEGPTRLIELVADPKSPNPLEVMVANENQHETLDQIDWLQRFFKYADEETKGILKKLLENTSEKEYEITAGAAHTIKDRIALLRPRLKNGELLAPKRVASIRFDHDSLRIEYVSGYADDQVNQMLGLYAQGMNDRQICEGTGVSRSTIREWREKMSLPNHYMIKETETYNLKQKEAARLYQEGKTLEEIGRLIGRSKKPIISYLRASGIKTRSASRRPVIYETNIRMHSVANKPYRYPRLWGCRQILPGNDYYLYETIIECIYKSERIVGRGATIIELEEIIPRNRNVFYDYLQDLEYVDLVRRKEP